MKNLFLLIAASLLFSSHELFLKTDSFFLNPDQAVELYLYNGTFTKSENIISRDRIVNALIVGPDYKFAPKEADYFDKDVITHLKFNTGQTGTYAAGITTLPRELEMTAEDFKDYLIHENLTDLLNERKAKGIDDRGANEKYSKHVKALLQVGSEKSEDYATEFGYPIEFLPMDNPYELKIGDAVSFKLLSKGKPLSNQIVRYSYKSAKESKTKKQTALRTDEDGIVSFELSDAGHWFVATIHIVESPEKNLDYESNWATLTFEVR